MLPTSETQHRNPGKFREKEIFWNSRKQNENWTKEAWAKEKLNFDFLGLGSLATILFLAVLWMLLILTFSEMCPKFPLVVQCNTRCKWNMQIEIPNESPRKTSTSRRKPFRLGHLSLHGTSSLVLSAVYSVRWKILSFFRQIKLNHVLQLKRKNTKFKKIWLDFVDNNLKFITHHSLQNLTGRASWRNPLHSVGR